MQDLINRLTALAAEHGATFEARLGPGSYIPGYGSTTNGAFESENRAIHVEYDPASHQQAQVELTGLHEVGHAATVKGPLMLDGFESLMYNLGGPTPRKIQDAEIAAWEWAIPRLSADARALAAGRIRASLDTYDVEPERIEALLARVG